VRRLGAIVAGLIGWIVVATVFGRLLRAMSPAYVAAEPSFAFTQPMLASRLAIGAAATLAGGAIIQRIANDRRAVVIGGIVLLALFVPQHVMLFDKFPLWYHALFLISLVPLTLAGGRIVEPRR
jgi:hypothetical protein